MTIRVRCPRCSHETGFPDEQEGTTQECRTCDARLELPWMVRYTCPSCAHKYVSGPQHVGRRFPCRTCKAEVLVPSHGASESDRSGNADSTGDHWFKSGPSDATPQLGPADADAALAGHAHGRSGPWIAGGIICAILALAIVPPIAAAAGAYCGARAKRLHHSSGQMLIIANVVTGLIGAILGVYLRLTL